MSPGDTLRSQTFGPVSTEKMKILAAILRDPNVIHLDKDVIRERGLGDKLINQGPTNLGYVTNMLEANFGPGSIARLTVRFGANVFEDDMVTAGGEVTEVGDGEITCDIWLDKPDGTRALQGIAVVRV